MCTSDRTFVETDAIVSFMEAFISIADTFIPAKERRFSVTDTMISASGTSLVASTICFPVPERTLGAVPAGVFVTPIHKREELILLLRKLAHYVQNNYGNDLAVFLSSGFLRWPVLR